MSYSKSILKDGFSSLFCVYIYFMSRNGWVNISSENKQTSRFSLLIVCSFLFFSSCFKERVWISLQGSKRLCCLWRQFTYRGSVTDGKLWNGTFFFSSLWWIIDAGEWFHHRAFFKSLKWAEENGVKSSAEKVNLWKHCYLFCSIINTYWHLHVQWGKANH